MARAGGVVGLGVVGWAAALVLQRSLRRVRGDSMAPTLRAGELVLTVPIGRVHRGDVVLLRDPRDGTHVHCKRVVGLPGEVVELRGEVLLVDGRRFHEPYARGRGPDGRLEVPAGHVVALGDARDASTDSRIYGPVPLPSVDRRVPLALQPRPRRLRARPAPLDD